MGDNARDSEASDEQLTGNPRSDVLYSLTMCSGADLVGSARVCRVDSIHLLCVGNDARRRKYLAELRMMAVRVEEEVQKNKKHKPSYKLPYKCRCGDGSGEMEMVPLRCIERSVS